MLMAKVYSWLLCFVWLGALLVAHADAKLYSRDFKTVQIRQSKSWMYLDRMRMSPGTVNINFWIYLQTETYPA